MKVRNRATRSKVLSVPDRASPIHKKSKDYLVSPTKTASRSGTWNYLANAKPLVLYLLLRWVAFLEILGQVSESGSLNLKIARLS